MESNHDPDEALDILWEEYRVAQEADELDRIDPIHREWFAEVQPEPDVYYNICDR